jgi:hypothetical protein
MICIGNLFLVVIRIPTHLLALQEGSLGNRRNGTTQSILAASACGSPLITLPLRIQQPLGPSFHRGFHHFQLLVYLVHHWFLIARAKLYMATYNLSKKSLLILKLLSLEELLIIIGCFCE